VRRRTFIAGLGSAAVWPVVASGQQQSGHVPLVGGLFPGFATAEIQRANVIALINKLQELGWTENRDFRLAARYSGGDQQLMRANVQELIKLNPDVILAVSEPAMFAASAETRAIPTVFLAVNNPVEAGYAENLAHPGGNATGFQNYELGMTGKSLQLLKEIVRDLANVSVIFNPETAPSNISYLPALGKAATDLGLMLQTIMIRTPTQLEDAIGTAGKEVHAGILFPHDAFTLTYYEKIASALMQYRVPAVFSVSPFVIAGGLISYGFDIPFPEMYRFGAAYIDRILRGAKPADLPIQVPTRTRLVINLKTARMLGLAIPTALLALADEVIE
jgi:putative ABC transport system substrate-binding protein